jgi:hypothetical protein
VEPTHPCARCGKPVPPGVGLCDECNPLGLRDVASGQVHGSVFIAVAVAIAVLAVLARLSIAGSGPFPAQVGEVVPSGNGLSVAITVTNQGDATGQTTCRLSRVGDEGMGTAAFVTTPRLRAHQTRTFESKVTEFGTAPADLQEILTANAGELALQEYVKKLRDKAKIEYLDETLKPASSK